MHDCLVFFTGNADCVRRTAADGVTAGVNNFFLRTTTFAFTSFDSLYMNSLILHLSAENNYRLFRKTEKKSKKSR